MMPKITEIIPQEIFDNPDLDWARQAFEEGNFFNVVVARIKELEAQLNFDGTTNSQRCDRCHLANFFNGEEFKCWNCGLEHNK